MDAATIIFAAVIAGIAATFIGVLLVFLGVLMRGGARVEGGGVVFLGPIPIVFGTSTRVTRAMLFLALAITLILAALFVAAYALRGWTWWS